MRLQIERTLFEDTVKTLNNYYAEAEKIGGQSYLEGCLACATAYLIFLCMETRYEKVRLWIHLNDLLIRNKHEWEKKKNPYPAFLLPLLGAKEDSQVHPGAEREDLRSQRSTHHRSYRKGNACRILAPCHHQHRSLAWFNPYTSLAPLPSDRDLHLWRPRLQRLQLGEQLRVRQHSSMTSVSSSSAAILEESFGHWCCSLFPTFSPFTLHPQRIQQLFFFFWTKAPWRANTC